MQPINFHDYKKEIEEGLSERLEGVTFPGETDGFTIIEGFFNAPIQNQLDGNVTIGGPSLPMIAAVGNRTGRVYYFALKVIAPNINFESQ